MFSLFFKYDHLIAFQHCINTKAHNHIYNQQCQPPVSFLPSVESISITTFNIILTYRTFRVFHHGHGTPIMAMVRVLALQHFKSGLEEILHK